MGADASAHLFYGINLSEIFLLKKEKEEYDIYDTKTGKKTGKKGYDIKTVYVNKHNGRNYGSGIDSLGINDKYIHSLNQDSDEYVIGILIESVRDENGGYEEIDPIKLEKAKETLDKILVSYLLLGNGLIAKVNFKLILNLYWSY